MIQMLEIELKVEFQILMECTDSEASLLNYIK